MAPVSSGNETPYTLLSEANPAEYAAGEGQNIHSRGRGSHEDDQLYEEDLYESIQKIKWENYLDAEGTFAIGAVASTLSGTCRFSSLFRGKRNSLELTGTHPKTNDTIKRHDKKGKHFCMVLGFFNVFCRF